MPKPFCVLMPVFQGMPYLPSAVSSVLDQTGVEFELWIRDDGSTDGSREYLRTLKDRRVKVTFGDTNLGLFKGLNELYKGSDAALVRVLCQDDLLLPGCLQRELSFFREHPEIGFGMVKHRTIDESGLETGLSDLGDLPEVLFPQLSVQQFLFHGCLPGNLSTVSVRASWFQAAGGFDESYQVSADYALWSKLAPEVPFGVLHQHLVAVRSHTRQLSRAKSSQVTFVLENKAIRKGLLSHLPEHCRKRAASFEFRRQGVLDWHQSFRLLLAGRFQETLEIWRSLGGLGVLKAMGYWLITLNNRIVPQAPWFFAPSLPLKP
jgi:glycosyltransferase involved in cell wall biosynthesis